MANNTHSDVEGYEIGRSFGREYRSYEYVPKDYNLLFISQALNKIKEAEVKQKFRDGKKIRVAFVIIAGIARFHSGNVYKAMREYPDIFEPFVVLYHNHAYELDENALIEHKKDLIMLTDMGFETYSGYDDQNFTKPLAYFYPDLVFISPAHLDMYHVIYSNTAYNINFLVCKINEGFNTLVRPKFCYDYIYNNKANYCAWKQFVETKNDYFELCSFSASYGVNALPTGSPLLDDFAKPLEECKIPAKIDNGKPIVIYAPHQHISNGAFMMATFGLYHEKMLELVKQNREINFVFKPHPGLGYQAQVKGIMSYKSYMDYIHTWASQPNGIYVSGFEYIDLFRKSKLLITDSYSFMFAWLLTFNPCLYLVHPERNFEEFMGTYTTNMQSILRTQYLCKNWDKVLILFKDIMLSGSFNKRENARVKLRKALSEKILFNIGTASQCIVDYLVKVLTVY